MKDHLFKEIANELQLGMSEKNHPFRFFSLGTMGLDGTIGLRTVVLRNVFNSLQLTFYTDSRSPKITEIQKNNTVSALFYHPSRMIQLRIEGKAHIEKDDSVLKKQWKAIPNAAQKDYNTVNPPGNPISGLKEIHYLNEENHFCMVHIIPNRIDFLKLGQPFHTRVQFSLEKKEWKGNYLVP
nr:pyridoxamine 5'-phosphate oxidase family protein [uncultured Allomuricauda sp.]